ncbi:MAG: polysaccharide deacetylase family protein [Thermoanaerobaculia bacterium]
MSTCHRHPERRAKRKCYRCRRVICVDCYWRASSHIFCSRACHLRFRLDDLRASAAKTAGRSVAAPLAAAIVAALVLPLGIVVHRAATELTLAPAAPPPAREAREITAAIDSIEEEEEQLVLRGRAAPEGIVFLLRDGQTVAQKETGAQGEFTFTVQTPDRAVTWAVAAVPREAFIEAGFTPTARAPVAPPPVRARSVVYAENFTRGPLDRREIVLSFDAGSSSTGTAEILDVLRDRGVRTTLFLTGDFVDREPDLVRRMVAEGHEIGNHTWSHAHLTSFARNGRHDTLPHVTREWLHAQLRRTAAAFEEVTGDEMAPYWRAPFGEENGEIRAWAKVAGYVHVGWTHGRRSNLDSLDWVSDPDSPIYLPPDRLAARLLRFGERNGTTLNGGIVLMHLGSDRVAHQRLHHALPGIIDEMREAGLRLVSVSEMRRPAEMQSAEAAGASGEVGR